MIYHEFTGIVDLCGTWTIGLSIDDSFTGITYPSIDCFKEIGEKGQVQDRKVGKINLDTLKLFIQDVHTTEYPEGFWYKICHGIDIELPTFLIKLNEGDEDTLYFYGRLNLNDSSWDEPYRRNNVDCIREHEISLLPIITAFDDVKIDDWIYEMMYPIYLHETEKAGPNGIRWVVSFKNVILALLCKTFGQYYDEDDVTFPTVAGGAEILYRRSSTDYDLTSAYFPVKQWSGDIPPTELLLCNYWDGTIGDDPQHLNNLYGNAGDLFFAICKERGLIPVVGYNLVNNHVQINFIQWDENYANALVFDEEPIEVSGKTTPEYFVNAIRTYLKIDSTLMEWYMIGPLGSMWYSTLPENVTWDIDIEALWTAKIGLIDDNLPSDGSDLSHFLVNAAGDPYTDAVWSGYPNNSLLILLMYIMHHVAYSDLNGSLKMNPNVYNMTYVGIKGNDGVTNTHANMQITRETSIDGNLYRANRITQKPKEFVTEIEWIQKYTLPP